MLFWSDKNSLIWCFWLCYHQTICTTPPLDVFFLAACLNLTPWSLFFLLLTHRSSDRSSIVNSVTVQQFSLTGPCRVHPVRDPFSGFVFWAFLIHGRVLNLFWPEVSSERDFFCFKGSLSFPGQSGIFRVLLLPTLVLLVTPHSCLQDLQHHPKKLNWRIENSIFILAPDIVFLFH